MNKLIVFANVKGGTGKSLLCAMFAAYLVDKGNNVFVVDADVQQTLTHHRERDKKQWPDKEPPYDMIFLDTASTDIQKTMKNLKELDGYVLIDCPGNIDDKKLMQIYAAVDIAIVPTRYDEDNLDATLSFATFFKKISKARMYFVPNSINMQEQRREEVQAAREKAMDKLKPFGYITPRIRQTVVLSTYSTILPINSYQRNAVIHAFEKITSISEN